MRNAAALLTTLLFAAAAAAQAPYGRITGRVADATGALIANAAVQTVNIETGVMTSSVTNGQGVFELLNLVPGTYRVTVEQAGFKRYERTGLNIQVGDAVPLNIALELGQITESVTVTGEAPALDTASGNVAEVIDNRRVQDLPIPGQSLLYLMLLTPGVISTQPPTYPFTPNTQTSADLSAGGTGTRQSEFTIDGIPNMTQGGGFAVMPPPEVVQEVRVVAAPYDASAGRFTGAQVNIALKSGTNRLHGDVGYTDMPYKLMAIDFFTHRSIHDLSSGPVTDEKIRRYWPEQRTRRFRAAPSGPVYIPKLYDGRNRTFWTFGFDLMRRVRSQPTLYTVPTPAEKGGDFSQLLALGAQYQIYDPATIQPAANGRFSRQPLPGNIIPASRLNAAATKLMTYYIDPNTTGTVDDRNNLFSPNVAQVDYDSQFVRLDQTVSASNRAYFSASWNRQTGPDGRIFNNEAAGYFQHRRSLSLAVNDVMTLSPNLILEMRYGVSLFRDNPQPASLGYDLNTLGFSPALARLLDRHITTLPQINVETFARLGDSSRSKSLTNYHTLMGSATRVAGTHTMKQGVEFRLLREDNYNYGFISPSYSFGTNWTRGPLDTSGPAPIGQGLASLMFGLPTSGNIDRNDSYAEQSRYLAFFFQDDWRATRRLTLNLGLRYELEFPTTERFNRSNRGFDFATSNPIEAAARAAYAANPIAEIPAAQFRTTGGVLFAGAPGVPRGLWNPDWNNFAPRFGMAYSLNPKTVVRGGYGIFYETLGADRIDVQQLGYNQRTSLVSSLDNGLHFNATIENPFPSGILEPAGSSLGLRTYLGRSVGVFWPDRRAGYVQRWSFGFQREVFPRTVLQVNYVGNRGTKLGLSRDLDTIPAQYLSRSPVRDQPVIDRLGQAVANPFFGLSDFAGSSIQGRTMARSQLLRPYPQFTAVTTTTTEGFSWYHALQLTVDRRLARGFSARFNWSWSKFMQATQLLNASDLAPHHAISTLDRPHRLVVSWIYELPFGSGKPWLSSKSFLNRYLLGGWSIQGIYQWQSGPPLGFGNIIFNGNLADIVLPGPERKIERWFNTEAGFERVANRQLASNIRTFPLRLAGLRAPGYNNLDISAFKTVAIRERVRVQFRVEALDAANSTMFGAPNMTPNSTLFGTISTIQGIGQRKITLGGKLRW